MPTARSLMRRFVAVEEIEQATVAFRFGEELPLDYLIRARWFSGYVVRTWSAVLAVFFALGILDFYSRSGSLADQTQERCYCSLT